MNTSETIQPINYTEGAIVSLRHRLYEIVSTYKLSNNDKAVIIDSLVIGESDRIKCLADNIKPYFLQLGDKHLYEGVKYIVTTIDMLWGKETKKGTVFITMQHPTEEDSEIIVVGDSGLINYKINKKSNGGSKKT